MFPQVNSPQSAPWSAHKDLIMPYWLICLIMFSAAYFINIFYITVFYHRGLAHKSVVLKPWIQRFVVLTGNWITGLDPKGWACMHRMHHLHSDTHLDPHSPVYHGIFGLFVAQLNAYNRTLRNLIEQRKTYVSVVEDLDFPVSWLNRKRLWFIPYLTHLYICIFIGMSFHAWFLGVCYWIGMMSHPIQGWMVNSLGHRFGYRNFDTPDNSKNNTLVAWFVMGEGYQNNHHHRPSSAKFSAKWYEIDLGYCLCLMAKFLKLLEIPRDKEQTTWAFENNFKSVS